MASKEFDAAYEAGWKAAMEKVCADLGEHDWDVSDDDEGAIAPQYCARCGIKKVERKNFYTHAK